MSLYSQLAEQLQYISPEFYKRRFFKKLNGLSAENVLSRKVEPEMLWLKGFLKKDAVFFDVGANVGAYLYLLEHQINPKNIFAFEPNPELFIRLKRLFPKISISDVALSDENTVAEFKIPVMNGKTVHTRGTLQTENREIGETASKIQKVQVISLDDWCALNRIGKIDFIKIDVEGNELKTLRGAKKSIKNFRPVLMVEIEQRHHHFPIWDIIEEVMSWGYAACFLDRNLLKPQPLTKEIIENQDTAMVKVYNQYINNIIFFPNE